MFSDQYEFLIEDFENKLRLIDQNKREILDLIKGDLKTFVRSLFESLGKGINFKDIETRLNDLQKIDLDAISKAAELFNREEFLECFGHERNHHNSQSLLGILFRLEWFR